MTSLFFGVHDNTFPFTHVPGINNGNKYKISKHPWYLAGQGLFARLLVSLQLHPAMPIRIILCKEPDKKKETQRRMKYERRELLQGSTRRRLEQSHYASTWGTSYLTHGTPWKFGVALSKSLVDKKTIPASKSRGSTFFNTRTVTVSLWYKLHFL